MVSDDKLSLFLFTFNCGKETPLNDQFLDELINGPLKSYNEDSKIPELLVFGFQELSSLLDGTNANCINIKMIKLSQLLSDTLTRKFNLPFNTISINHFGSIGIILISPYPSRVKKVLKSVDPPLGHYLTNTKGATAIRIRYEVKHKVETEFTFVVAHLNANEGLKYLLRRNQDLLNLLQGSKFDDGWSILKPDTHCFIMGDLNYRASGGYHFNTKLNRISEQSEQEQEEEPRTFDFDNDELNILIKKGKLLWGFDEAKVKFKPTYKFKVGTNIYNSKRTSSWCDRILYLSYGEDLDSQFEELGTGHRHMNPYSNEEPNIIEYNSLPSLKISDHIPVYLKIEVPSKAPASVINSKGYLVDRFTHLSDNELYLKPVKIWDYYRFVGSIVDELFGSVLFIVTTRMGRLIGVTTLVAMYLLYRYFVIT
ncbi:hypothetical protein CANARDRAFT_203100 [[Candida] arabinofermentans NRRL YB-2248]|uniref:Inositol polyphosphate-related phosphatase domain-containing protein n=1 Tax=[Candida] arabinofermentans NRRL YB-2248 TaxID=983967 RepID=A0A1E4SVF1_9ASCO|nr:hypothetical protein CANARDRAFT_203100 [[Candida] arabinofermentans NRRL YB-2248]